MMMMMMMMVVVVVVMVMVMVMMMMMMMMMMFSFDVIAMGQLGCEGINSDTRKQSKYVKTSDKMTVS